MRAKQQVDLTSTKAIDRSLGLLRATHAGNDLDLDRQVEQTVAERGTVLLREDRGRREHQHLLARFDHAHRGAQRDLGLAKANVAADQAIHRTILGEIVHYFFDRAGLVVGLAVGEALLDALQQLARFAVCDAWHGLALRIQDQQLAGHLAHGRARTRL